jgi:hypothetical protein
MATEAQAGCFLARRPDIRNFICANRPEVCAAGNLAIVQWWWDRVLVAPGTGDWDQKVAVGGNLDAFLAMQGCGGATPAPGPGGGGAPGPVSGPGTGRSCAADQISVFGQCVEKTVAYVAAAAVVLLLLRRR